MHSFEELGLSKALVEAVSEMGFEIPTAIQKMVIPKLIQSPSDMIALAQTGTGKTAAFGLPLIEQIDTDQSRPQGLILAPTRELALQITAELQQYAAKTPALRIATVYGGADIRRQIRQLKDGVHLVVATPGRLVDLINRKRIDLEGVRIAVLDEADEMLNMGFREDLDIILENTPTEKVTWLFSATMSADVKSISQRYLRAPLEITAGDRNSANSDIEHQYILLKRDQKYEALCRLLDYHPDFFGLLFCRTRRDTLQLASQLTKDGYPADAINGELSQAQREQVMDRFRNRRIKLLVATDVAARGLDVEDLSHVLHFNLPDDIAFYTHRSGRTGRAGKQGTSIALLTRKDLSQVRQIEKRVKIKFAQVEAPSGSAILKRHLEERLEHLVDTPVREDVQPLLPSLMDALKDLSKEEIIARMASSVLSDLMERYEETNKLSTSSAAAADGPSKVSYTSLFINVGKIDRLDKGSFLRMVCETSGISGSSVGRINLQQKHSYFDVEESVAKQVMDAFKDAELEGRALRVNPADDKNRKRPFTKKDKKKHRKGRRKNQWA